MNRRGSIIGGLILIIVGTLFLLAQLFPELAVQLDFSRQWPLFIVGTGLFFLLGGVVNTPRLAIPGMIIMGTGGILYYQNLTGNWASWAYIWTLYPGFVGLGMVVAGLLARRGWRSYRDGFTLIGVSLALFTVFGAFFNGLGGLGEYWPLLLIIAGGWMLLQNRRVRGK